MGDKKGDPQARAELLGKLLLAIDEKPYLLRYGSGKTGQMVIMVPVTEAEAEAVGKHVGKAATTVRFGKTRLLPLQLKDGTKTGQIDPALYDAAQKRWTGTIAVTKFK